MAVETRNLSGADVVIIGAGQAGPATAASMYEFEPKMKVTVIDGAKDVATGASTASAECFRSGWTPRSIAQQMKYSLQRILNPETHFGVGAKDALNVQKRGYVYLGEESDAERLQEQTNLMNSWHIDGVEFLDNEALHREFPWVPKHFVCARVDRNAGWLNSDQLAKQHKKRAQNARFMFEVEPTEIVVQAGQVKGVRTTKGFIEAPNVVIAAGPSSRSIAKTAGVDLPIVCAPRQRFDTVYRHHQIPSDAPFVIAPRTSIYFRPQGEGMLFGWATHQRKTIAGVSLPLEEPMYPVRNALDERLPTVALEQLRRQFHDAQGVGFGSEAYKRGLKAVGGYYVQRREDKGDGDMFTSERAIIGPLGPKGLVGNLAHSGHGIMTSPAAGYMAAKHVLGQVPEEIPLWGDFLLGVPQVESELGSGL